MKISDLKRICAQYDDDIEVHLLYETSDSSESRTASLYDVPLPEPMSGCIFIVAKHKLIE